MGRFFVTGFIALILLLKIFNNKKRYRMQHLSFLRMPGKIFLL
jgi:hypothetical protein